MRKSPETFWGRSGAGVLFTCSKDLTLLLGLRSESVEQPLTWGIFGGSCDGEGFFDSDQISKSKKDDSWDCAVREAVEEIGYFPKKYSIVGKVVFRKNNFQYTSYVVDIPLIEKNRIDENHNLNWENDEIRWFSRDDAKKLKNLHFGVKHIFSETV